MRVLVSDALSEQGLAILRQTPSSVHVDAFLMSCRVLKRGVEDGPAGALSVGVLGAGHEI